MPSVWMRSTTRPHAFAPVNDPVSIHTRRRQFVAVTAQSSERNFLFTHHPSYQNEHEIHDIPVVEGESNTTRSL